MDLRAPLDTLMLLIMQILAFFCPVVIIRKRLKGMPMVKFVKFPTYVEYFIFTLVSKGRTNKQVYYNLLFSMSSMKKKKRLLRYFQLTYSAMALMFALMPPAYFFTRAFPTSRRRLSFTEELSSKLSSGT